ncbi:alpha/beta hydrolase [Yinghuangia sp. YIM S09857]|uniref:alpha/beta hydrolase n=1 Tax=Yinghuangia sp. YIM S09857 TaxID=3436929 RepID=UPI003F5326F1
MPLNAELAAFLDAVPLLRYEGEPAAFRAKMDAGMGMRPVTTELPRVADRTVPGPADAPELAVRVYAPSDEPGLPVTVFYHGGGFCIGSIASHDPVARKIAADANCVVVSVEYRLAPEHPYPAAYEDAYAAYAWAREHAADIGGDPGRVAVAGDSAGGSLAAGVCLMARDRGIPQPTFQLLWYPGTGLDAGAHASKPNDPLLPAAALAWFAEHYYARLSDAQRREYAAVGLVPDLSGLAPAHIVVAGEDPLHAEGVAYAERLREAGVPVGLDDHEDLSHGFVSFADFVPPCAEAARSSYAALRDALAKG